MRALLPQAIAALLMAVGLLSFASGAATQDGQREEQWLYRDVSGEGPVAAFLDWRYGSVVFRVSCNEGYLLVRYTSQDAVSASAPMALLVDGTPFELPTLSEADAGNVLVGRIRATPQLLNVVMDADTIDIDAPNEMGEPWYLGRAEPLRRVLRDCAGF